VGAAGATTLGRGLYATSSLTLILTGVLLSFVGVALLTPLLSRPVVAALGRLYSWSLLAPAILIAVLGVVNTWHCLSSSAPASWACCARSASAAGRPCGW
jgi:hypothetical protein